MVNLIGNELQLLNVFVVAKIFRYVVISSCEVVPSVIEQYWIVIDSQRCFKFQVVGINRLEVLNRTGGQINVLKVSHHPTISKNIAQRRIVDFGNVSFIQHDDLIVEQLVDCVSRCIGNEKWHR